MTQRRATGGILAQKIGHRAFGIENDICASVFKTAEFEITNLNII